MALLADFENFEDEKQKPPVDPGKVRRTGPVNIDYVTRESQNQNEQGRGRKTVDQEFSEDAYADKLNYATGLTTREPRSKLHATVIEEEAATQANQAINKAQASARAYTEAQYRNTAKKLTAKASLLNPAVVASRARATGINLAAVSWASYLWLFVQVPFAILGAVSLGVMGLISSVTSATGGDPGFWANILNTAASAVLAIFATIGIDFLKIAEFAFLISYVVVLAIGFITLFTLYLQYTLGLLRPLSGQADGLKFGMLLLAVIGYCLPLANLFPWATAWMMAVWFYPR